MPMVVNTGVTNRNHTPGIYSAETTAALPAPGSMFVWVLDKQAGILYVDNGTTLVPILVTSAGPAPVTSVFGRVGAVAAQAGDYAAFYATIAALANYLPLAGGTLTGPLVAQDIQATKATVGGGSAIASINPNGPFTLTNLLDLVGKNNVDGSEYVFTFQGVTQPNGTGVQQIILTLPTIAGELALLDSPPFTGVPTAPTAALGTNTTQLATTAFVLANAGGGAVSSVFTRTGAVVALVGDYAAFYLALTGGTVSGALSIGLASALGLLNVKSAGYTNVFIESTNAANGSVLNFKSAANSSSIWQLGKRDDGINGTVAGNFVLTDGAGTLVFVVDNGLNLNLKNAPTAPTAAPGTNTTQLATTAFVQSDITAALAGYLLLTGGTVSGALSIGLASALGLLNVKSAGYTNVFIESTNAANGSVLNFKSAANSSSIWQLGKRDDGINGTVAGNFVLTDGAGTLVFVVDNGLNLNLKNAPTAPTAAPGTNTTQLATTAFVQAAISVKTVYSSDTAANSGSVTFPAYSVGVANRVLNVQGFLDMILVGGLSVFNVSVAYTDWNGIARTQNLYSYGSGSAPISSISGGQVSLTPLSELTCQNGSTVVISVNQTAAGTLTYNAHFTIIQVR